MCISASPSSAKLLWDETHPFNSHFARKAPSPWRTLDTFPAEVRRFRVPEIEEIRISSVYSGATGFCCKRIPFVPGNSPGSGSQAVVHIIDYSRDSFTSSYVSFGLLKLCYSYAFSLFLRLYAMNNQETRLSSSLSSVLTSLSLFSILF